MGRNLTTLLDQQILDLSLPFDLTAGNSPHRIRIDRFRERTLIVNSPGGGPAVDVDLEANGIVGRLTTVAGGTNTVIELPHATLVILTATGAGTARYALSGLAYSNWGDLPFNA